MKLVPLTLPVANNAVALWHRHHAPLPGGFAWFCVGVVADDELVGAAIAGRPTNRNNDDGQTVEVIRVATNGHRNACSMLLGACARAARAVGAWRIITYTLDSETGASLRGAGWEQTKDGITSWWTHAGSRTPAVTRDHHTQQKVRWERKLADPVEYTAPAPPKPESQQGVLGL